MSEERSNMIGHRFFCTVVITLCTSSQEPSHHKSYKLNKTLWRMSGSFCNYSVHDVNWWCSVTAGFVHVTLARTSPDRRRVDGSLVFSSPGELPVLDLVYGLITAHCVAGNTIKIINGWRNAIKESAPVQHGAGWTAGRQTEDKGCVCVGVCFVRVC